MYAGTTSAWRYICRSKGQKQQIRLCGSCQPRISSRTWHFSCGFANRITGSRSLLCTISRAMDADCCHLSERRGRTRVLVSPTRFSSAERAPPALHTRTISKGNSGGTDFHLAGFLRRYTNRTLNTPFRSTTLGLGTSPYPHSASSAWLCCNSWGIFEMQMDSRTLFGRRAGGHRPLSCQWLSTFQSMRSMRYARRHDTPGKTEAFHQDENVRTDHRPSPRVDWAGAHLSTRVYIAGRKRACSGNSLVSKRRVKFNEGATARPPEARLEILRRSPQPLRR